MSLQQLYEIYRSLRHDKLSLIYRGEFSDDITDTILSLSEQNIGSDAGQSKMKRKVSFLMAECFQNIIRHRDLNAGGVLRKNEELFITRNIGHTYYITSANLIEKNKIEHLKKNIEYINTLNKEELKALSMEILTEGTLSAKGGGGLGLVEMARRSKQKLEYAFEQADDTHSNFYLRVVLDRMGTSGPSLPLSAATDFHRMMREDNILLIYKGDFSSDTIMPVLKMMEDNMESQAEHFALKKKVYMVMVEMLQNISRHAEKINNIREGLFLIGRWNQHYIIKTGNFIKQAQIRELDERLNYVTAKDSESLKQLYRQTLSDDNLDAENSGLGIIDIARNSSQQPDWSFTDVGGKTSFFAMEARV